MMNKYLIAFIIFAFSGVSEGRDLKTEMAPTAFSAAGLDKLTEAELAVLNAWLAQRDGANAPLAAAAAAPAPTAAASAPMDRRGLPAPEANDKSPIESRIVGTFSGWTGNTRFVLENGQEWVQTNTSESFSISARESPSVIIRPAFMGSWLLKLSDANTSTRVRRVK